MSAAAYAPRFADARRLRALWAELEVLSLQIAEAAKGQGVGGEIALEKCGKGVIP